MKPESMMAGVKLRLIIYIKHFPLEIVVTTALALLFFTVSAGVSESQEPTYSPEVDWYLDTATTTQPAEETATTSTEKTQEEPQAVEKPEVYVPPNREDIVEEILKVFPEAPIMVAVAKCESNFDPLADRESRNVDVGLFQINQVHLSRLRELGLDRRNLQDNLTYARMLYEEQGLGPWYMSEHCWSQYL